MKNKNKICLIALVLFSLAGFLPGMNNFAQAQGSSIPLPTNVGLPDPGVPDPVVYVITNVLDWILTVFLLLAVIGFVVTGIQYLMAFGNSYTIETAKRNFVYSTIAVATVGAAMIIIYTIERLLE